MNRRLLTSLALVAASCSLFGCMVVPQLIQKNTVLTPAGRGALEVFVKGNFGKKSTQATAADIHHVVVGLQTIGATASQTLGIGDLTNGNASASVTFGALKPCVATVSVEAFDAASSSIGLATASATVEALKITHLNLNLQLASTGPIALGNLVADTSILDSHYRTTTFAGNGTVGYVNGNGADARFNNPSGMTIDASGNLFVCDYDNYRIREITSAGVVSTFAGDGIASDSAPVEGPGTAAHFVHPMNIAVAPNGNFYVADYAGHCLEKMTAAGDVTIFPTTHLGLPIDLGSPTAIAVGPSGNIYVANFTTLGGEYCHTIYKIDPVTGETTPLAGGVTTTAGFADGTGAAAKFFWPNGLAVDAEENVYVADSGNNRIRKITPAREVTTLAGSADPGTIDGPVASARFSNPCALTIDGHGNLFVCDFTIDSARIRKITPAGVVSTLAGSIQGYADAESGSRALFRSPFGIAVDPSGNIYVSDKDNQAIRKITP